MLNSRRFYKFKMAITRNTWLLAICSCVIPMIIHVFLTGFLASTFSSLFIAFPVFCLFAGFLTHDPKKFPSWFQENRRRIVAIVLSTILLLSTIFSLELFARASQGYLLWAMPIEKTNVFFQLDKVKKWNQKFYESRESYFRNWPIPIDFFESDKQEPRYIFKPNVALKREGNDAIVVKPNSNPNIFWHSNSWGFRGEDIPLEKPNNTLRIVCLGASTTEGSQGDLETYPYFLKQELAKRYPNKNIEVINAGHHGQGIGDLLEILRQRVLPLKPDLLIFYEGNNDIGWSEFYKADSSCVLGTCWLNNYSSAFKWAYLNSAAFVFIADKFGWTNQKPDPVNHQFISTTAKSPIHYREVLNQIVREARRNNITIVLSSFISIAHEGLEIDYKQNSGLFNAVYKQFYPYTPGEINQIYQIFNQQSASVARELDVPYANVAAKFPKELQYFPFDLIHLSPDANKILATLFSDFLSEQDVFKQLVEKG